MASLQTDAVQTRDSERGHTGNHRTTLLTGGFWGRWGFQIKLVIGLLFPLMIETLDYTVVASAQPQIASAFNRLDIQSWIGTSYILTSTSFLPVFANITNIFGRYATVQVGLIIFTIGSALSTAAQTMPMLLAGRGISGVGAAALLTATRAIFADARDVRWNAIQTAMISTPFAIGYSVGPVVGAALSTISFRWIFAINLPIASASVIVVFLLLRHDLLGPQRDPRDDLPGRAQPDTHKFLVQLTKVDWIGSFIFVVALILILLGMNWGSTQEWNQPKVIATLVVGGVLLLAFLAWELFLGRYEIILNADGTIRFPRNLDTSIVPGEDIPLKEPPRFVSHTMRMMPLYIFTNFNVIATSLSCFAGGMLMFGCFYFIAIYFNISAGFSSSKSGAQLLYFAPGLGGGVYLSLIIVGYLKQPKYAIIFGQLIQPISLGLLGMAISKDKHSEIDGFLAMCGVGVGATLGTAEMAARFALANEHTAISVTMCLFFRFAGGTIGLAQQSAVLESKVRSYITNLVRTNQLSLSDAITIANGLGSLGRTGDGGIEQLPPHLRTLVQDAYRYGTKWAFYSLIPWAAVAAIPCLFLRNIQLPENKAVERKNEGEKKKTGDNVDVPEGSREVRGRDVIGDELNDAGKLVEDNEIEVRQVRS